MEVRVAINNDAHDARPWLSKDSSDSDRDEGDVLKPLIGRVLETHSDGDSSMMAPRQFSNRSNRSHQRVKKVPAFSRLRPMPHRDYGGVARLLETRNKVSTAAMKQKLPPKQIVRAPRMTRGHARRYVSDRRTDIEHRIIQLSEESPRRVGCYCCSYPIPFNQLCLYLSAKGRESTVIEDEVLHEQRDNDQDIFYYPFGSIVMWGLSPEEELQIYKETETIAQKSNEDDVSWEDIVTSLNKDTEVADGHTTESEDEMDEHLYVYFDGLLPMRDMMTDDHETDEVRDDIDLRSREPRKLPTIVKGIMVFEDHMTREEILERKMAYSFGLAQSVKLQMFESSIAKVMDGTMSLPQNLVQKGTIDLSKKEVSKVLGRIFIERNSVSLHADVLDTPDFFWDREELEPIYARTCKYLDMEQRVSVLNSRLDLLKELFDMLRDELESKHSARLEWIVIWLIAIEIVLGVLTMLLDMDIIKPVK